MTISALIDDLSTFVDQNRGNWTGVQIRLVKLKVAAEQLENELADARKRIDELDHRQRQQNAARYKLMSGQLDPGESAKPDDPKP